jgi:hypothetical protein
VGGGDVTQRQRWISSGPSRWLSERQKKRLACTHSRVTFSVVRVSLTSSESGGKLAGRAFLPSWHKTKVHMPTAAFSTVRKYEVQLTWVKTFAGQSIEALRHPITVVAVLVRFQFPGWKR